MSRCESDLPAPGPAGLPHGVRDAGAGAGALEASGAVGRQAGIPA